MPSAYEGTDIISCLQSKYIMRRWPYITSRQRYIIKKFSGEKNLSHYKHKSIFFILACQSKARFCVLFSIKFTLWVGETCFASETWLRHVKSRLAVGGFYFAFRINGKYHFDESQNFTVSASNQF